MTVGKNDSRNDQSHYDARADLSVVIPVYNTEEVFIRNCLSSVAACQSLGISLEVVIVDDGSAIEYTEWLYNVVKELVPFARIISKDNGGQNSARRVGLEYISGRYVLFLDSDDVLEPEELGKTLSAAVKYEPGILCYNLCRINEDGAVVGSACAWEGDFRWIDPSRAIFESDSLSRQLYRRDVLQQADITLVEGPRIGEDMASAVPFLLSTETIASIGCCPYRYVQRHSSVMHSVPASRVSDIIDAAEQMLLRIPEESFNRYHREIESLCIEHVVYWGTMRAFDVCGAGLTYHARMSEWMDGNFPGWRVSQGAMRAFKKYGLKYVLLSLGFRRAYGLLSKIKKCIKAIL